MFRQILATLLLGWLGLDFIALAKGDEQSLPAIKVEAPRLYPYESTINRQALDRESANDMGQALSAMPGVAKIRKGGIANDVVVRGFYRDNISVLTDNQKLFGACPNRMDPPAFHTSLAEIESVTVIKGPFDIRHQGSMGGSVAIITKKPLPGLHANVDVSAGSFSSLSPSLDFSYGQEKGYFTAGYHYGYSMPYRDGHGRRFTSYANYQNDDRQAYETHTYWNKFGFSPFAGHLFEFAYSGQQANDVLYPYLMMDGTSDRSNSFNGTYTIAEGLAFFNHIKLQIYHNSIDHWMDDALRTSFDDKRCALGYCMGTDAESRTSGTRLEGLIGHWALGFEAYQRNWDAQNNMFMSKTHQYMLQNMIPDVDTTGYGLFGEYRADLTAKARLIGGIRMDTVKTQADDSKANTALYSFYHHSEHTSKRDTYPSANMQFFYTLSKDLLLFAGIGHTARVPDAEERYVALRRANSDWVGNPNLDPPQNTELDLAFDWTKGSFTSKATVFYSYVTDFITLTDRIVVGQQARSYANTTARFYGGDWQNSWQWTPIMRLTADLSYVRGKKDTDDRENLHDSDVEEMPPLTGSVAWYYEKQWYYAKLEGVFTASQNKVNADLKEEKTAGYSVFNVSGGIHYQSLALAVGIDNLLDKAYTEYLSYLRDPFASGIRVPEPGRFFYAKMSYRF